MNLQEGVIDINVEKLNFKHVLTIGGNVFYYAQEAAIQESNCFSSCSQLKSCCALAKFFFHKL